LQQYKELKLNVDYLREQLSEPVAENAKKTRDTIDFAKQLLTGIEYYRSISDKISSKDKFNTQLDELESEIRNISSAGAKAS